MPLPRTGMRRFSFNPRSSEPLKRTEPLTRAFLGSRPIVAMAVTDLPEPDSPTMPSTSPGESSALSPLTAWTVPSLVGKSTNRFSTLRTGPGMSGAYACLLRVESLTQSVSDQEDRKDEDDEEDRREGEEPPLSRRRVLGAGDQ